MQRMLSTASLSNFTMMSPDCTPPLAAGPSGVTAATSAPLFSGMPSEAAMSSVTVWIFTPSQPRRTSLELAQLLHDGPTTSAGTAKPMPIEPPVGEMIAVFTPMTSPSMLNSGPPELPLLMAASVCR